MQAGCDGWQGCCPATPARDDVIVVAAELATKAVTHTRSGRGGSFGVETTWYGPRRRA